MKTTNTTQKNLPETVEKNGITYRLMGDVYLPMIGLTAEDSKPLGRWGRMRRAYLKEHRSLTYQEMLIEGTLMPHLSEIEQRAQTMFENLMTSLAKQNNVTENLKASDPMKWTGMMNNLRATAEEMIQTELIYS